MSRPRWYLSLLVAACLALAGPAAHAQADAGSRTEVDAQIQRIQLALKAIQSEQQSVYQQFQMVQEMQRADMQQTYQSGLSYTPPPTPPNYDDVVREQQERQERIRGYGNELERLYGRYRELEEQKRPLLDELSGLAAQR